MKSAHVPALHYVVDWLAKPETRDQLAVEIRFSRNCRAGAEHFDPTAISFDHRLMEDEEDDLRRTLEQEREESQTETLCADIGSSMWRELVDDSD